jgi:hypothetical protein
MNVSNPAESPELRAESQNPDRFDGLGLGLAVLAAILTLAGFIGLLWAMSLAAKANRRAHSASQVSGLSLQVLPVASQLFPLSTPAANGAFGLPLPAASVSLRIAHPVVPARGFPAAPADPNQPAGSRSHAGAGVFSCGFPRLPQELLTGECSASADAAGGLTISRGLKRKAVGLKLRNFYHPMQNAAAGAACVTLRMIRSGHLAMAVSASHAGRASA